MKRYGEFNVSQLQGLSHKNYKIRNIDEIWEEMLPNSLLVDRKTSAIIVDFSMESPQKPGNRSNNMTQPSHFCKFIQTK